MKTKIWEKMLHDRSSGEEGRATRRLASDALSFAWLKRRAVRWIGETTCRLRSGRTTCRSRPLKQDPSLTENDVVLNNQNDTVLIKTSSSRFHFFSPSSCSSFLKQHPLSLSTLSHRFLSLFRLSPLATDQDTRRR